MTNNPRPASKSTKTPWIKLLTALSIVCALAIVHRNSRNNNNPQSNPNSNNEAILLPSTQQSKQQSVAEIMSHTKKTRNMVGGYSNMDTAFLNSEEVLEMANYALAQHAGGASTFFGSSETSLSTSSLAVSPAEVESGAVRLKVLEASRQVVAGLNYKLTLALFRGETCLGAFDATVYKPLPYMQEGPRVTSWGKVLGCEDIGDMLSLVEQGQGEEETTAIAVEEERREEIQEVEPDA
mmetsp:Transcript_961/g.1682  ORF Transcript_961/g.1682 Transcript_961/m.1682 type:complete len:238 (+) Transcript_961:379-1092(+)